MSNAVGPLTLLQAAEVAQWYEAIAPHLKNWLSARGFITAQEADDIVQETFVRVIQHAPQLATYTPIQRRNYVFTIAKHLSTNGLRRWSRRAGNPVAFGAISDLHEVVISDPASAEAEWLAHAQPYAQPEQTTAARLTLRAVWEHLEPKYRAIVLLIAEGRSPQEMADTLGITLAALWTRIYRMRVYLLSLGEKIA